MSGNIVTIDHTKGKFVISRVNGKMAMTITDRQGGVHELIEHSHHLGATAAENKLIVALHGYESYKVEMLPWNTPFGSGVNCFVFKAGIYEMAFICKTVHAAPKPTQPTPAPVIVTRETTTRKQDVASNSSEFKDMADKLSRVNLFGKTSEDKLVLSTTAALAAKVDELSAIVKRVEPMLPWLDFTTQFFPSIKPVRKTRVLAFSHGSVTVDGADSEKIFVTSCTDKSIVIPMLKLADPDAIHVLGPEFNPIASALIYNHAKYFKNLDTIHFESLVAFDAGISAELPNLRQIWAIKVTNVAQIGPNLRSIAAREYIDCSPSDVPPHVEVLTFQ